MSGGNVFVTVGTTKFDQLIESITHNNILELLKKSGYESITLQIGNGSFEPQQSSIININYYRLKSSIKDDIRKASLVISHAGAGSCLEVLGENKPLIAVVNEDLMGNHQLELANALSKRNYLRFCTCKELESTLRDGKFNNLVKYQTGDPRKFVDYLNKCVGFY